MDLKDTSSLLPGDTPLSSANTDHVENDSLVSLSSALASLKLPPSLTSTHSADETVDFPSNPNQMKLLTQKSRQAQGLPLSESEGVMDEDDEEDASIYQAVLSPDCADVRLLKDNDEAADLLKRENRDDGDTSDLDKIRAGDCGSLAPEGVLGDLEEYYEDVPLADGSTMSRQESFRRLIKGVKVEDAAEFARIGRVVASGELSKHDSIRRKLVGHNSRPALFPTHFEEGDPRALWSKADTRFDDETSPHFDSDQTTSYGEDVSLMSMLDRTELPESEVNQFNTLLADTQPASIVDEATLSRLKACFDSESFKDLYTLAGRLQDLLSPQEVEEIIANQVVYSTILDKRIVSALTLAKDEPNSTKIPPISQELDQDEESGFMFVRHDSKRLCSADADRVIEGLFVESMPTQGRKILPFSTEILDNESSEDPNKSFGSEDDLESRPQNSLVLDVTKLPRTPQPLSRQLAYAPAGNKSHRKKRIAVSADILNGPCGDDVESDTEAAADKSKESIDIEDVDCCDTLSLDSPDVLEESIMERLSQQQPVAPLPELSAKEERAEERNWKSCIVAGLERQIDMKVIAPYKRVLHHGGYLGSGSQNAIIVFTASYLPDRSRIDYDYVMDNLFLYVLTTLDQLVAEDYILVYLHGTTSRSCMPTFGWLKRCYHMIDRRLRKNLKGLYLVHPTFWLKTIVVMTRPFVSTKFSRKLSFVETLTELAQLVPLEQINIPERVKQEKVQECLLKNLGVESTNCRINFKTRLAIKY